jgi:hypothetical protein
VQAVLAHPHADRGELDDLVALRGGRVDALVLAEDVRAGLTALRPVFDQLVDALERQQRPVCALVSRLAAPPAARGWLPRPRRRRRRVLRGRKRGVARAPAQLLFELLDAGLETLVARRQHEDEVHTTLPPRGVDALRLMPLHTAGIRRKAPGPCPGTERLHLFAAEVCTGVCTESHESRGFARLRVGEEARVVDFGLVAGTRTGGEFVVGAGEP